MWLVKHVEEGKTSWDNQQTDLTLSSWGGTYKLQVISTISYIGIEGLIILVRKFICLYLYCHIQSSVKSSNVSTVQILIKL